MGSKSFLSRLRSVLLARLVAGVSLVVFLNGITLATSPIPPDKPTSYPAWWFERDVIKRVNPANTVPHWANLDYPNPDDYAVANLGQLKQVAAQAAAELNAHLPGGAGADINALVGAWSVAGGNRDDYHVLNLGQLKAVAKPFYDRLIAVRFTKTYPWASGSPSDDWAAANLGQVKSLFSFDVAKSTLNTRLPDWWISAWRLGSVTDASIAISDPDGDNISNLDEFLNGTDPTDYYNGQPTVLTLVSGADQTGLPGNFLPQPIIVSVAKADGTHWTNAPVNFSADKGLGGFATVADGSQAPVSTLTVRTDSNGVAQVFFQPAASVTGFGYARASVQQVHFAASGYDPNSSPSSRPALSTSSTASNQTTLSWNTNATNGTSTTIQRWTYDNGWQTIGTVAGQTGSFTDTNVPQGEVVAYRVINTNGQGSSAPSSAESSNGSDLTSADTDGDGLTDAEEIDLGTNPKNPDTDGDGTPDGKDIDPLDPDLMQLRVPPARYMVIDAAVLKLSKPVALNDSLTILDGTDEHARIWRKGDFVTIPDAPNPTTPSDAQLAGSISWKSSISNLDQIIGSAYDYSDTHYLQMCSFVWSPSAGYKQLTYSCPDMAGDHNITNDGVTMGCITPSGRIVGQFGGTGMTESDESAYYRATVMWNTGQTSGTTAGVVATSTDSPYSRFDATCLNDHSVAGGVYLSGDGPSNINSICAAVMSQGSVKKLPGSGAGYPGWDSVNSISDSTPPIAVGWIWGQGSGDSLNPSPAVMWPNVNNQWGTLKHLQKEGSVVYGDSWAINNRCEIIGDFTDENGEQVATFWQNGKFVDLNKAAESPDFDDFQPIALNNNGAMIAGATRRDGGDDAKVLLIPVEINSMDRFVAGSFDQSLIETLGGDEKVGLIFRNKSSGETYSFPKLSDAYIYNDPYNSDPEVEDKFLNKDEIALGYNGHSDDKRLTQEVVFYRENGKFNFRALFDQTGDIEIAVVAKGAEVGKVGWTLSSDEDIGSLAETTDSILSGSWNPPESAAGEGEGASAPPAGSQSAADAPSSGSFARRGLTIKALMPAWDNLKSKFANGLRKAGTAVARSLQAAKFGGKGFCEGAWMGVKGDVTSIAELAKMAMNPAETAKTFYEGFKALMKLDWQGWKNVGATMVKSFLETGQQGVEEWEAPNNLDVAAYLVGYTTGFIAEQIAVTYITAGILKAGNIGAKVGEFIRLAAKATPPGLARAANVVAENAIKIKNSIFRRFSQDVLTEDDVRKLKMILQQLVTDCCPPQ